jgi:hypothetical protein
MKLPRWLVVCMLSVSGLSVLGAAGWWWVTWPERTAQEFVRRITEEDWDVANAMFGPLEIRDGWGPLPTGIYFDSFAEFSPEPRSVSDIVIGRSVFSDPHGFGVVVERGHVTTAGMIFEGDF